MTTPRADRSDDAAFEAALAWYDKLQDETPAPDTWQAFTVWLESDPANAPAFGKVEDLHTDIDDSARQILLRLTPDSSAAQGSSNPAPPKWWPWLAGAAVAGGVALVAILLRPQAPAPAAQVTYAAPPGHVRTVTLADGSRVDLSPGSLLATSFDPVSRRLTLDRGEAVITVGHDARPLTLRAAGLQMRDIGTEFDVAIRPSHVTVTVVSGLVAVSSGSQANAVTLAAGQQLVHVGGAVPDQIAAADPQTVLSWRTGFQTYRNAALSDIVADLDRNFAAHVSVPDAATGARRFSGVLKVDTMEATLGRLAALLDLSVVHHGDAVELAGPGAHP